MNRTMCAVASEPERLARCDAREQAPSRRYGRRWGTVIRVVVIVAALLLLARLATSGLDEMRLSLPGLTRGDAPLVSLVLALEVGWLVCLAHLARTAVVAVGGAVSTRDAVRISMGAFTASRVVPGGGAAGGVFAARELIVLGNPPPTAFAGLAVSWFVATMTLAALTLGAAAVATATGQFPLVYLVPPIVALVVVSGGALVALRAVRRPGLRHRLVDLAAGTLRRVRVDVASARWEASLDQVAGYLRSRRHLLRAGGWAVGAWLCDAAALWVVFHMFGFDLGLTQIVVGYTAANLINSLPEVIPGWVGVFEAALTTTYVALGVPVRVAVVAVLAYRLASFWLPVAAGVLPALSSIADRRHPAGRVPAVPDLIEEEQTP